MRMIDLVWFGFWADLDFYLHFIYLAYRIYHSCDYLSMIDLRQASFAASLMLCIDGRFGSVFGFVSLAYIYLDDLNGKSGEVGGLVILTFASFSISAYVVP